ncbi:ABC transporter related protein [uncultured spirochete]|jgi:ATP-binding cassette subfamily F protein uup|uniref:ABC transporter related protein n=1 Tax=uncultured spirochete TaxID=156406 RepID=A0A3P3XH12_9SPIR|nr:ABC-F family ATP-binding cassette domain-containing protein [Rectinema subterraneum]SLM11522.1 ABC transporter related protein [uncultured spirochete]
MNILSLKNISLSLKSGPLFESVRMDIDERDHIGLIGKNGAGKTSLLRLIAGLVEPDRGTISRTKNFTFSYLAQNTEFDPSLSLREFLYQGESTEIRMLVQGPTLHGRDSKRDHEAQPPISVENRYFALLRELGFSDFDAPMQHLSGGELKKAALARALAPYSNFLILDEPTNHLDVETIEWLESRLRSAAQAFILVTHDRWFLDATVNRIAEIERHTLTLYPGSYAKYLEKKSVELASLSRSENKRLANLKIELEWLNRGARARATKSERRKKEIEAMRASLIEKPAAAYTFMSQEVRLGKKVCVLKDVSLAYGDRALFRGFSHEFLPGSKTAIIGPNGSGKTSLLSLIAGLRKPTAGSITLGETVRLSFFRQTNEAVNPEMSILDYIQEHADHFRLPDGSSLDAVLLLERFGFERTFQMQKLRTLSGGEIRRLMLVRLLAESPNFLLLDEPTNDLDIETIERLEEYLSDFSGSLIVVSHDRLLVDRLAQDMLIITGKGTIERFTGTYFEWNIRKQQEAETQFESKQKESALQKQKQPSPKSQGQQFTLQSRKPQSTPARTKLNYKEQKELEHLTEHIEQMEQRKKALEEAFQGPPKPGSSLAHAKKEYDELCRLIESDLLRWEELADRL